MISLRACISLTRVIPLLAVSWIVFQASNQLDADLFVSAASRNAVMRFDNNGNLIGDFVAPNSGGLTDPQGITFGPDGHLYVSSHVNVVGQSAVLRYHGQTGAFLGVFANLPDMVWPAEINFRNGLLYVSDFSAGATGRVSRFDLDGNLVDHFANGILAADGQSWDSNGNLLVSSFFDGSVRQFNGTTGVYMGNFVAAGSGGLAGPLDNLLLPNGHLLVSSFNSNQVKEYDANGNFVGNAINGLPGPQGLAIGPDGFLYAGSFTSGVINRYDPNTFAFQGTFANAGNSTTNNFVFHTIVPEPGGGILLVMISMGIWVRRRR